MNEYDEDLSQYLDQPSSEYIVFNRSNQTIKSIGNFKTQQKEFDIDEGTGEDQGQLLSFDKKQRNRMAAKQSRDRRKMQIQHMQAEQKKLQGELFKIEKQLNETRQNISNYGSINNTVSGFASRSQLLSKMAQLICKQSFKPKPQHQFQDELLILIDSINFRMGAMGRQRLQKQNQCYKQMINLSLPPLHRYAMWIISEKKHAFTTSQEDEEFVCVLPDSISSMQELRMKIQVIHDDVLKKKEELMEKISALFNVKNKIQGVLTKIDRQVNKLRDFMSPNQIANLILSATKNTYKRQLLFFKQDLTFNDCIQISKPVKRVKRG